MICCENKCFFDRYTASNRDILSSNHRDNEIESEAQRRRLSEGVVEAPQPITEETLEAEVDAEKDILATTTKQLEEDQKTLKAEQEQRDPKHPNAAEDTAIENLEKKVARASMKYPFENIQIISGYKPIYYWMSDI